MEPMTLGPLKSFTRTRIPAEFPFCNRLIDSSKILINDSARPKIEVTYFRVPHLSFGEADIETARA